ncbi:MAG TPA: DNA polymerase III subunit delta [Myxococcota bacterium]|nr:DNA polymerase III subunit delta [Myxococcota bacterium]
MNITQLQKSLSKSEPATVYLVSGEEGALVDRALDLITERVLSGAGSGAGSAEFALSRLDAGSASAEEVEVAARTASLFGGRRLVVLKNAHLLRPEEQKKLCVYLAKPVATATLVLVIRGAGADSRNPKLARLTNAAKKYAKAVEKGGGVSLDCPRPRAKDLPRLAESLLGEQGLSATRDGLYALCEAVGEDMGAMIQAAEKLALYLGKDGRVEESHVAEVVADTRSQSVFALTDAAGEGALDRALRVLAGMVRDGESPLAIVSHLARHFRSLARVAALDSRGDGVDSIRKRLGLHPFVVKKCLMQSRRLTPRALASHLQALAAADRALKSSGPSGELLLEKLVMTLCGR